MGKGRSFTILVSGVEATVDVDVDIYPYDFTAEMVKEWVDQHASSDDIDYVFGNRPLDDDSLDKAYARGNLSLFQVIEFINLHREEILLHIKLFGNK